MKNKIKYFEKKGFGFSDLKQYEVGDYITLHDFGHTKQSFSLKRKRL